MKSVLIYAPKGGPGKTTLCRELAVAAGPDVAVVDLDPQKSLTHWREARQAQSPILTGMNAAIPQETIRRAREAGADWLFIDSPPASGDELAPVIAAVDAVLVPVRASPDDVRAVAPIAARLDAAGKRWAFVLTQTTPRSRLADQTARRLAGVGRVAPVNIGLRSDFPAASIAGETAFEMSGKGADEVRELFRFLKTLLQKDPR